MTEDERVSECKYGDWTGKPLKVLAKDPLWRVVQAHPSAVTFPGGTASRCWTCSTGRSARCADWNAALGKDAAYVLCSHGDVIKAVLADSLGLHLDLCQRIQVDPCSLTVIRYTPLRPFLIRMNDTGGGTAVSRAAGSQPPRRHGPAAARGRRDGRRRGGRIGVMPVYSYDPPDRFVAGTVGQPGERTFYLQASASGRVTSVALEKVQVSLLAERLDELLDEVLRRSGGRRRCPRRAGQPGR